MIDPDACCTCGHFYDEHDAQGYCLASHFVGGDLVCDCVAFEEADES